MAHPYISAQFAHNTQEETLDIKPQQQSIVIGLVTENNFFEKRILLTPQAVAVLVNNGNQVWVQHKAGEGASFTDKDYSEAGAKIIYSPTEIFKAHLILSSAPLTLAQIQNLQHNQFVISPMHLPTITEEWLNALLSKKITAIALEDIKDEKDIFPVVRSMSEIAGSSAILIAAQYLSKSTGGNGILLGGITGVQPAKVVILGAGVVGEFAAKTAIGLGATVSVFDNSIYKLMRLQNHIGTRLQTHVLDPHLISTQLQTADVVVGAIAPNKQGRTPQIVTDHMVSLMQAGSVIIDVSIDRGGCFETSEITNFDNPIYYKHGVIHYCIPNIASNVSRTASKAISNILMPILLQGAHMGGMQYLIQNQHGIRNAVYSYNGHLTHSYLAQKFNQKFTDLNLLLTAPQN